MLDGGRTHVKTQVLRVNPFLKSESAENPYGPPGLCAL